MPEEKEEEAAKPKTTKKTKTKTENPWPVALGRVSPGQRFVMKGGDVLVSKVDWRGRPEKVEVRKDGKTKIIAFKFEDFLRIK